MNGIKIAGIGVFVPEWVVTNEEVAKLLQKQRQKVLGSGIELTLEQSREYETSPDWIEVRTGILERRFAAPEQATSDLASASAAKAWTDAYGDGLEIPDFLLVATVSPDYHTTPPTSVITHRKMHIPVYLRNGRMQRLIARDITLACSSFVAAFQDGYSLVRSGECQRGLVIGADVMTRVMSWNRRSPFVILADGSGSFVLDSAPESESWIGPRGFFMGINGGYQGLYEDMIKNRAGGSALPISPGHLDPRSDDHMMVMLGNQVYTTIVPLVSNKIIPSALEYAGLKFFDIDVLILHQANFRMTKAVLDRLVKANPNIVFRVLTRSSYPKGELIIAKGMSLDQGDIHIIDCYNNIDHFGNTTSASIPLCIWEARELKIIRPGKRVMAVAFGGGYSWGSVIIEWGGRHLPEFNKK